MMNPDKQSFLGTGWGFPLSFDKVNQVVRMVSDAQDIAESIRLILNTTPGERIMQPTFGCNLSRLVFENVDSALVAELNHIVYHALLDFEPRVNFIGAAIRDRKELDGILHIEIQYSIVATNTRHNLVFPFYLWGEGTNV
jgi:phage baseplate assembly protein W